MKIERKKERKKQRKETEKQNKIQNIRIYFFRLDQMVVGVGRKEKKKIVGMNGEEKKR